MTEENRSSPDFLKDGLDAGRFVSVHTLDDHFEQDLVEQALDEAKITHAIWLSGDSEFALIFADAQGFGQVLVRAEDAEAARQICADIRATDADAQETVKAMFDA